MHCRGHQIYVPVSCHEGRGCPTKRDFILRSSITGREGLFPLSLTHLSHPQREEAGRGRVLSTSKNNIPETFSQPPTTRVPKKFWQCYCASRSPAAESLTLPRSERESGIEGERAEPAAASPLLLLPQSPARAQSAQQRAKDPFCGAPHSSVRPLRPPVRMEVSPPK